MIHSFTIPFNFKSFSKEILVKSVKDSYIILKCQIDRKKVSIIQLALSISSSIALLVSGCHYRETFLLNVKTKILISLLVSEDASDTRFIVIGQRNKVNTQLLEALRVS